MTRDRCLKSFENKRQWKQYDRWWDLNEKLIDKLSEQRELIRNGSERSERVTLSKLPNDSRWVSKPGTWPGFFPTFFFLWVIITKGKLLSNNPSPCSKCLHVDLKKNERAALNIQCWRANGEEATRHAYARAHTLTFPQSLLKTIIYSILKTEK